MGWCDLVLCFNFFFFFGSFLLLNVILLCYKNLYISKSWSIIFIITALQLSHISIHVIITFVSNFPIIFLTFTFFYKNNYTFSNLFPSFTFSSPLSPLSSTLILLFIFPFIFFYFVSSSFPSLPFHLLITLHLNITIHLA